MRAAFQLGVQKVVYVSSAITMGISDSKDFILNEACNYIPEKSYEAYRSDAYTTSKKCAERLVWECPINTCIVNPTTANIELFFKIVDKSKVVLAPPGGTNIIDVEDVADGIIAALDRGYPKQHYILSNINTTYADLYRKITSKPVIALPQSTKKLCGLWADLSHGKYMSRYLIENAYGYKYYSNVKARLDLKWEPKYDLETIIERHKHGNVGSKQTVL